MKTATISDLAPGAASDKHPPLNKVLPIDIMSYVASYLIAQSHNDPKKTFLYLLEGEAEAEVEEAHLGRNNQAVKDQETKVVQSFSLPALHPHNETKNQCG